ncbi:MAG: ABC transporter substrate-binding protein [Flavobacteriaceae bacterium]|nr:ABC transporter substrate-binding protein [Flavobacteriaceae bacterium]
MEMEYAEGFRMFTYDNFVEIEIRNTSPGSDEIFRYALIDRVEAASITLNKDEYDGIILTPVQALVVTSTTHIPSLELLGVEDRLKGFPGSDYISSERTRKLVKDGQVRELGSNEGINTEVLIDINPEVLVGFSVNGRNRSYESAKKAGVTVLLNGDWVESDPLAKAEWIKFFGALFQKESLADSIFKNIRDDYNKAVNIAENAGSKPVVMSGAMYKDIWYLPAGSSPEAKILKDANVDYIWSDSEGTGSLSLSFETVFNRAKEADIWISPSNFKSKQDLLNSNERYGEFKPFKTGQIYSFTNVTGETGGIRYYELGIARPDLVLKDIIKICHPELLPHYQTFFFKTLPE